MTQLRNAYCNIIVDLDEENRRVDIPRRLIENMLSGRIGAAKPATLDRHIRIMVDLGYLKLASSGYGPDSLTYDLVAKKLRTVKANMEGGK